jgi:AraC family transcriptional regulator
MAYEITVQEIPAQPVMSIRTTIAPAELAAAFGQLLPAVWQHVQSQGGRPSGPPFGRYHAFTADHIDLEAGIPVEQPVAGDDRILASELPGGRVALTWHVGHYERLQEAYRALESWMQAEGVRASGGPWETYWTDPGQSPDPATWRTEIRQPIQ